MVENAAALESVMWRELKGLDPNVTLSVRGQGLFFAIVIKPQQGEEYIIYLTLILYFLSFFLYAVGCFLIVVLQQLRIVIFSPISNHYKCHFSGLRYGMITSRDNETRLRSQVFSEYQATLHDIIIKTICMFVNNTDS